MVTLLPFVMQPLGHLKPSVLLGFTKPAQLRFHSIGCLRLDEGWQRLTIPFFTSKKWHMHYHVTLCNHVFTKYFLTCLGQVSFLSVFALSSNASSSPSGNSSLESPSSGSLVISPEERFLVGGWAAAPSSLPRSCFAIPASILPSERRLRTRSFTLVGRCRKLGLANNHEVKNCIIVFYGKYDNS